MGIWQNVSKHFQSLVRLIRFALESRHKSQGLALKLPSSDPSVCVTSIKPRILPLFAHCFFPQAYSYVFTWFHMFFTYFQMISQLLPSVGHCLCLDRLQLAKAAGSHLPRVEVEQCEYPPKYSSHYSPTPPQSFHQKHFSAEQPGPD